MSRSKRFRCSCPGAVRGIAGKRRAGRWSYVESLDVEAFSKPQEEYQKRPGMQGEPSGRSKPEGRNPKETRNRIYLARSSSTPTGDFVLLTEPTEAGTPCQFTSH